MVLDLPDQKSLAVLVDQHTHDLLRALCTRIGTIMEDEAATALTWSADDPLATTDRLVRLHEAGKTISQLAAAGLVLMAR